MAKKASTWRKSEVAAGVIAEHETAKSIQRELDNLDLSKAFVVDKRGEGQAKVRSLIKRHTDIVVKSKRQIAKEEELLAAARARKAKRAAAESRKVFDLWDEEAPADPADSADSDSPTKRRKVGGLFVDVPAVPKPKTAWSVNTDEETWKDALISAAAKVPEEEDLGTEFPVQRLLEEKFDSDIISTLNFRQQFLLLRMVRESPRLLEMPEDFLARVMPVLVRERGKTEVKKELSDNDGEIGGLPTRVTRRKTQTEKNKKLQKAQEKALADYEAERQALLKDHENLHQYLKEVHDEREREAAVIEYNRALKEAWKKTLQSGENSYKLGNARFEEPVEPVILQEDRERQSGSLRRLKINTSHNILIEERLASFRRRGLVEPERNPDEADEERLMKHFDFIKKHRTKQINRLGKLSEPASKKKETKQKSRKVKPVTGIPHVPVPTTTTA